MATKIQVPASTLSADQKDSDPNLGFTGSGGPEHDLLAALENLQKLVLDKFGIQLDPAQIQSLGQSPENINAMTQELKDVSLDFKDPNTVDDCKELLLNKLNITVTSDQIEVLESKHIAEVEKDFVLDLTNQKRTPEPNEDTLMQAPDSTPTVALVTPVEADAPAHVEGAEVEAPKAISVLMSAATDFFAAGGSTAKAAPAPSPARAILTPQTPAGQSGESTMDDLMGVPSDEISKNKGLAPGSTLSGPIPSASHGAKKSAEEDDSPTPFKAPR